MQKYIYVVFSSTPYLLGILIQKLTGNFYNHVSIALNPELTEMYGFARRYCRYPFYGGFVRESLSRYHLNGKTAQMKICQIPVPDERYQFISDGLHQMYAQKDHFLYNHLSVFGTPFRRVIAVKDAYICVEFVVQVLSQAGISVNPRQFYTIHDLEILLQKQSFYTGPAFPGSGDPEFFSSHPVPHPYLQTVADFCSLFARLQK